MKQNDIEILKRYSQLPQEKKQIVINVLLEELEKFENEGKQQSEEICKINGHIYSEKNDGWKDNSYCISSPSSITTRKRLVDSLIYHKIGKEDRIFIKWSRSCWRCGKRETINKIPSIILKKKKQKEVI